MVTKSGSECAERVYLSFGSNLGDRRLFLTRAVSEVRSLEGVNRVSVSSIYETEPVGLKEQPLFLNIAASLSCSLEPLDLLRALRAVETKLGRSRARPGGPRVIDIDILLFGERIINSPELTVPHPRMLQRRFVLLPLVEIEPGLVDPVTGQPLESAARRLGEGDGWVRLIEPWPEFT